MGHANFISLSQHEPDPYLSTRKQLHLYTLPILCKYMGLRLLQCLYSAKIINATLNGLSPVVVLTSSNFTKFF